jgi:hypothetical protein
VADVTAFFPSNEILLNVGVVPSGFPGAGTVKGSSSEFYDFVLSPDGSGTYNVDSATLGVSVGAVGFAYLKAGSPSIYADSMFLSEGSYIRIYNLTANGDPDSTQSSKFVTGGHSSLNSGAVVFDPITNDLLFIAGGSTIYLVTGFAPPAPTQGSE